MLNRIIFNNAIPFEKNTEITFKQFNLFIGKNGSGKSYALKYITRIVSDMIKSNNPYDKENVIYEKIINNKKVSYIRMNANDNHILQQV